MVKLFNIENGVVVPSEHCYTLRFLARIMDRYPDSHMKIYQYLFYMYCNNPELNPFFNIKEIEKEELILRELDADFDPEDTIIADAAILTKKMYETPTLRAYMGIKQMLDGLADYMGTVVITDGRDGNLTALANVASKFDKIRDSFKGALRDLEDEQKRTTRGGQDIAYDQK